MNYWLIWLIIDQNFNGAYLNLFNP